MIASLPRRRLWLGLAGFAGLVALLLALWDRRLDRVPELPPAKAVLPGAGFAQGLGFTADGSTLVTADHDGRLQVWDVAARRLRAEASHPFRFPLLAVAPDGRWAAVGGWIVKPGEADVTRIYEASTGRLLSALSGTASPCDLAASADGRTLTVVVSRETSKDLAVQTWDTANWQRIAEVIVPAEPAGVAYSARLFNDGRLLALVSQQSPTTVTLWDVNTGQQTGTLRPGSSASGSPLFGLALSPDGRTLAAAQDQARVVLWDVATGRVRATLRGPRSRSVYFHLAFTADGRSLVGSGHGWEGRLPNAHLNAAASAIGLPTPLHPILEWVVWDVAGGQVRSALTAPAAGLSPPGTRESIGLSGNFALTSDGQAIATSHPDGKIMLRDQEQGAADVTSVRRKPPLRQAGARADLEH